jgi:hypothetical protein
MQSFFFLFFESLVGAVNHPEKEIEVYNLRKRFGINCCVRSLKGGNPPGKALEL